MRSCEYNAEFTSVTGAIQYQPHRLAICGANSAGLDLPKVVTVKLMLFSASHVDRVMVEVDTG